MVRLIAAVQQTTIVLHYDVNVMEYDAVELKLFHCLHESDVHHSRLVENGRLALKVIIWFHNYDNNNYNNNNKTDNL